MREKIFQKFYKFYQENPDVTITLVPDENSPKVRGKVVEAWSRRPGLGGQILDHFIPGLRLIEVQVTETDESLSSWKGLKLSYEYEDLSKWGWGRRPEDVLPKVKGDKPPYVWISIHPVSQAGERLT